MLWRKEMQSRVMDLANSGYCNELLFFGSDLYRKGKIRGAIAGTKFGLLVGVFAGTCIARDYYEKKEKNDK